MSTSVDMNTAYASTSVDMTASTSVDTNLKRGTPKEKGTTKAPGGALCLSLYQ